jgi:uncharacterized membrane protein
MLSTTSLPPLGTTKTSSFATGSLGRRGGEGGRARSLCLNTNTITKERYDLKKRTTNYYHRSTQTTALSCCRSSLSSSPGTTEKRAQGLLRTKQRSARFVPARAGGTSLVPVSDRVVAFLPYLLPLISGLRYSRYFFAAFPAAIIMLQPLLPIVKIVATLPLGNLIPFFAAYLGVARNQNLSRFCRFNGMQAILLDIVLIFPGLLESLFSREILGITIPYFLSKWMYNVIWVGLVVAFALCAVGCATGRYVNLPVVSEAAEAQMR